MQWFQRLQQRVHHLPTESSWACCVGNGSQDLIFKAFQVLTDPGDTVLVES